MNIKINTCICHQIIEINERAQCNNRTFRDLTLSMIEDPVIHKAWGELQDDYRFRIHLLKMFDLLTIDDCFSDMETLNQRLNLALEDLRGFCWCCSLQKNGRECHHSPEPKCKWWMWDGVRRLSEEEV